MLYMLLVLCETSRAFPCPWCSISKYAIDKSLYGLRYSSE